MHRSLIAAERDARSRLVPRLPQPAELMVYPRPHWQPPGTVAVLPLPTGAAFETTGSLEPPRPLAQVTMPGLRLSFGRRVVAVGKRIGLPFVPGPADDGAEVEADAEPDQP